MVTFWGSTFESKSIDETLARAFATQYDIPVDLSNIHPPDEGDYAAFLKKTKDLASGRTESSSRGWHHAGPAGCRTLLMACMCNEGVSARRQYLNASQCGAALAITTPHTTHKTIVQPPGNSRQHSPFWGHPLPTRNGHHADACHCEPHPHTHTHARR